jgi:transketolase
VVRSHIAHPAPHASDTSKAHGAPLGKDEVAATKRIMGFDPEQTFQVPDGVYAHMSQRERGTALQDGWQERFAAWSAAFPVERADWDQVATGKPRPGLAEALPVFPAGEGVATRDAGKKIMQAFKSFVPTMIGGSADLVESNKTVFEGGGLFSSTHAGRNIPFGIREHAMGAIVNGLAAHGGIVKPYGATFLVFSDYMRGAVRLSALMGLPVVWVWTHDSLGVGEDGPTHQPIEHVAVLRAIPNLWVIRPGDANEASIAWKIALEREDGPVALILSRQKLATLDRTEVAPAAGVERGGYILWDSAGTPEIILIGTGSELSLALDAGRALAARGRAVRVVSLPCIELFAAQPQAYRDEVLPPGVRARVAVEAGISMGWHRWVGDGGDVVGVDRFGHSAPGDRVFAEYGFTVDNVTARALALLERD